MSHPAAAWLSFLPEDEVPFILKAVLRAGQALRKKSDQEREDHVSNRLRKFLRRDEDFRASRLRVDRETEVFKDEEEAPCGRIDFYFLSSRRDLNDWHFAIEAKRLHVTFPKAGWKDLVSEYTTGPQGMMCFINERYSPGLSRGGMLGYVYDGKVAEARATVSASIAKNTLRLKMASDIGLAESLIVPGDMNLGETLHNLSSNPFTIYHLFLAV